MSRVISELVGAHEIAQMFGVSRQRISQLTARPDFPRPVVTLAMGSVWDGEEVRQWARKVKRVLIGEQGPEVTDLPTGARIR